jgi:hypothetical protein
VHWWPNLESAGCRAKWREWIQFAPLACPEVPTGSASRPHLCGQQTPNHTISPLSREFLHMKHSLSMNVVGSVVLPSGLGFLPEELDDRGWWRGAEGWWHGNGVLR